jgi:hypothetical protein
VLGDLASCSVDIATPEVTIGGSRLAGEHN